jgi:hypothetical protein
MVYIKENPALFGKALDLGPAHHIIIPHMREINT